MKGITLWQPFASLIAVGAKTIETRSWGTSYRGPLAIHAGKRWDETIVEACRRAMRVLQDEQWPGCAAGLVPWQDTLGRVVAVCRLAGCEVSLDPSVYTKLNREFGDLTPGRYAWLLADIRAVVPPVACRGSMGLWDVPAEVAGQLRRG